MLSVLSENPETLALTHVQRNTVNLTIVFLFSSIEQRLTACSRKTLSPSTNYDL